VRVMLIGALTGLPAPGQRLSRHRPFTVAADMESGDSVGKSADSRQQSSICIPHVPQEAP